MNLNIREMLPQERDYAYTQSYQIMAQSGCITFIPNLKIRSTATEPPNLPPNLIP